MNKFDKFMWWFTEGGWFIVVIFTLLCCGVYTINDAYKEEKRCESVGGTMVSQVCLDVKRK